MRVAQNETTVLIADPPWPHANGSRTNSGKSPKYPLMSLTEIAELRRTISDLAGDNAVLYLWATGPHLPGAIDILHAWDFTYRSFHVWAKTRIACGFWARSNAEIVFIGERGRPAAPSTTQLASTIFTSTKTANHHSSKPTTIHEIVERLWPEAHKVELFARHTRPGWKAFGSELGTLITPTGIRNL